MNENENDIFRGFVWRIFLLSRAYLNMLRSRFSLRDRGDFSEIFRSQFSRREKFSFSRDRDCFSDEMEFR